MAVWSHRHFHLISCVVYFTTFLLRSHKLGRNSCLSYIIFHYGRRPDKVNHLLSFRPHTTDKVILKFQGHTYLFVLLAEAFLSVLLFDLTCQILDFFTLSKSLKKITNPRLLTFILVRRSK